MLIRYGGVNAPYALFVHEKSIKFLERPFRRRIRGMSKRLVDHLVRAVI